MSRALLLSLALSLTAALSSASIEIGPETPCNEPVVEPAHSTPRIATNGSGYLVTWSGGASIFALPVSPAGQPLRERAVPVDTPTPFKRLMDLASDGSGYLAATISASGINIVAIDGGNPPHMMAERLLIPLTTIDAHAAQAQLTWNGTRYLLVFTRGAMAPIIGLFLDRSGAPAGEEFVIESTRRQPIFSVASNGDGFVLAGTSYDNCDPATNSCRTQLFTDAISRSGGVTSRYVVGATNNPLLGGRAIVFAGSAYVLVWSDSLGTFRAVNEVPLDPNGVPLHGAVVIATGSEAAGTMSLGSARTGDGAVAFVEEGDTVRAVRIGTGGEPVDAAPVTVIQTERPNGEALQVDAAGAGSNLFAVWPRLVATTGIDTVPIVTGASIDFSGATTRGSSLAVAAPEEQVLDIAAAGRTQLVAWSEWPALERPALYVQLLVDSEPARAPLHLSGDGNQVTAAEVTTDGRDFMVVWSEVMVRDGTGETAIRAALVRQDGTLVPVGDLARGTIGGPSITWTGESYFVSWTESFVASDNGPDQRVLARRLSADGLILDAAPRQIDPGFRTAFLRIVPTPGGLVALFLHGERFYYRFLVTAFAYDVYAAHISPAGNFLDTPVQITKTEEFENDVHAAVDPESGNLMLTWTAAPVDYHFATKRFATLLSPALTTLRSIDLSSETTLDVAWSGTSFLVASLGDQVYLRRFSSSGEALPIDGSTGPAQLTSTATKGAPSIAGTGIGAVVAYTRSLRQSSGSDARRVVTRSIWDLGRRRSARQRR